MACIRWALERDEGHIVLGWHLLPADHPDLKGSDGSHGAENIGKKEHFDELHKRKIDLADEVFVLNIDGYIGDSTRSEIEYAVAHGKPVRYLEPVVEDRSAGRPDGPDGPVAPADGWKYEE